MPTRAQQAAAELIYQAGLTLTENGGTPNDAVKLFLRLAVAQVRAAMPGLSPELWAAHTHAMLDQAIAEEDSASADIQCS